MRRPVSVKFDQKICEVGGGHTSVAASTVFSIFQAKFRANFGPKD